MTLHEMLVDEIRDLYHAEKQLTKALPKMAKAASHEDLREAFEMHLEETREQVTRLEEVFDALGEKVKAKPCAGMAGIIEEGNDTMKEDAEGAVLDAALIAAAQRAEHYEIGAYGTCAEWARLLGLDDVVALLETTLEEEKAADKKLTALAESEINKAAVAEGQSDEEEEEQTGRKRSATRSNAGGSRRQATSALRTRAKAADRRRR
ncbi:MAG TPA: ferritin-like domain-containing protein [Vicinamibacterales bacterium]|nr:ferritin-like domain-containing protein [Vicinamibacterales bacterium]